jgi:hypothetical protein
VLAVVAVGLGVSSSSPPHAARNAALKAVAPVAPKARRLPTLRVSTLSQYPAIATASKFDSIGH